MPPFDPQWLIALPVLVVLWMLIAILFRREISGRFHPDGGHRGGGRIDRRIAGEVVEIDKKRVNFAILVGIDPQNVAARVLPVRVTGPV